MSPSKKKRGASGKKVSPAHCRSPGCLRRSYARGLCQTHHRQLLKTGKLKPIRPYRPRAPGTVKHAGLRLSAHAAELLDRECEARRLSRGAIIAEVLEEWTRRRKSRAK